MAVHGELRPDDNALPLIVAAAALNKADSAMTRPTGSVRIDNGDGTETWMGDAASESGGIVQWVGDTTPPARPTGFTAVCQMGVVVASWDGTLAEPVPADFSHVEVFAQKDGDTTVTDAGALYGAGSVTLTGYAEGAIIDLWAVAYDDAHNQAGESTPNASPKSDVVTVIIEPVVSQQQLADKASEILSAASEDAAKQVSRVQSDLTSTKQQVESNTSGVQAASTQIADTDSRLSSLSSQMTSGLKDATDTANTAKTTADNAASQASTAASTANNAASSAATAVSTANNAANTASTAKTTADNAANTANAAVQKVSDLSTQLTQVKQTADGKNRIYLAENAPTGSGLTPGDQWYQRSNYRTYAEGEPDKSVSVMEIPSSRIRGVYVWDGSSWNEKNFVASNILATGTVGAKELAADAIYGKTLQGGKVIGGTVRGADFTLTDSALATTIAQANSSGVFFGDSLSYAKANGKWVLTVKDGVQSGGDLSGVTVTGSTIQTTSTASRGVKITSGGLVAYDRNGAATLTVDATSGSILMKGAVSTNSTLNTPAINSGTVTGAVIQTTATANRGVKIDSGGLKAWDGNGNQTLDLNGSTNTMTGIFRTAASGNRIEISNTTYKDDSSIATITGHDKYGNVNWLIEGDIGGAGIYGNRENPPDPLDTSTLHIGVSKQNPEINITGWGNGYRQISMGADRVDFTSSSVSDRTHVPDAGIYINGIRLDPYYVTDISKILTFEDSNWSEYKGAGGNDPRTRLLIVGNLRFLTLELQRSGNINARWRAGTILPEHIPANGINAAAAMSYGGVGDAYIIGRNVDSGATDVHGNPVKAGEIYIDPVSDYVGKSYWFCATFIYQV